MTDYVREFFDTCSFNEVVAIVVKQTWEVMNAKKQLKIEWSLIPKHTIKRNALGGRTPSTVTIPAGLESTAGS
jgi:hypothetical protein